MSDTAEKKVEVSIRMTERVTYYQTRLMPESTYKKLAAMLDGNRKDQEQAAEDIGEWLDKRDVYDWDDPEVDEFEIEGEDDDTETE